VAKAEVPRVALKGIVKRFPGVRALEDVDFTIHAGEVHALLGENGAGKSTLIKVLTGALARDDGEIRIDDKPVTIDSPAAAQALGISTVYQELNLVPTMSVTKNLTLEYQPKRFGLIAWGEANKRARAALARMKLEIDVERPLAAYSVAVQQLVAIARALEHDTLVLVLDEPTASLDAREVELLFGILRDLKTRGIGIVFITHFLDQVYQIADRITVLRNGRVVGSAPVEQMPRLKLVSLMLGRELGQIEHQRPPDLAKVDSAPMVAAEGLGRKHFLAPIDLTVRDSEVVGLAGLLGSGRTETAKLLFGAVRADSGHLSVGGKRASVHSPRQAIRLGFGFCPEDRKGEGIFPELTVRENIMLALQSKRGWLNRLSLDEQNRLASEMIGALKIATPDAEKPVGQLSGGNQQKVILARWMVSESRLLILDEPTRGIDVGAHEEVVALIRRLCAEGLSLLVASSELDEIVAVSNRVVVMRDRAKVTEIDGSAITREAIIHAIAGG
jgi:galactofuranose transport system ATP-binding protein